MRTTTTAACLLAVGVLAACTSTVPGSGRVSGSTAARSSSPARTSAPANRFARTPVSTAVGDPVTLDFCAAISPTALQQPGYEVSYNAQQYVPGCSVRLTRPGSTGHLSVLAFVTSGVPTSRTGRTTGTLSGLTVYRYPYLASEGDCERDVVASGVTVKISAAAVSFTSSSALSCAGTEAAAEQVAKAMAARSLPKLAVASPSLTSLDGCAIATAAKLAEQPILAGSAPSPDDFGVGCGFVSTVSFYLDPVIETTTGTPAGTHAVQSGGHTLYADDDNGSTHCSFVSLQGHTSKGAVEELLGYLSPAGSGSLPANACDATEQMVAAYLDTAGLT